jgi:hypothetical protein
MSAASQEARSGAERRRWFAAASAAVERRQASAPLHALPVRGAGRETKARGRIRRCGRKVTRLSAFRLPDFYEPGARSRWSRLPPPAAIRRDRARSFSFFLKQNSGAGAPRERSSFHPPLDGEGRAPQERGVGCGASISQPGLNEVKSGSGLRA